MPGTVHSQVKRTVGKAFVEGAKSFLDISSLFIAMIAVLFSYLSDRSHADLADTAFVSSVTVLVFLLPAAGIVGSYLVAETKDALSIIASPEFNQQNDVGTIADSLREITDAATPLQRGFSYTTLAVVLSALSLVQVKQTVGGVEIDRVLAAISLALLVGTAVMIFPMTWQLLQLKQVMRICSVVERARGQASDPLQAKPKPYRDPTVSGQERPDNPDNETPSGENQTA